MLGMTLTYHTVTGQKSESLLERVPSGFRSDLFPSTVPEEARYKMT